MRVEKSTFERSDGVDMYILYDRELRKLGITWFESAEKMEAELEEALRDIRKIIKEERQIPRYIIQHIGAYFWVKDANNNYETVGRFGEMRHARDFTELKNKEVK